MPRSRVNFLLILGTAVLIVIGIQAIRSSQLALPTATPPPPLEIEVAVNPLLYDWVNENAHRFNVRAVQIEGQTVRVRVTRHDGVSLLRGSAGWSDANHPMAWIPEASFLPTYAVKSGWNFNTEIPSLASTYLVWGAFQDRVAILSKGDTAIDWVIVQAAARKGSWKDLGGSDSWGFVKPAFPRPSQNLAGLAALLTASAAYHQDGALTDANLISVEFQKWLQPIVEAIPNFATLGPQPAASIGARGASVADFALLPESEFVQYYNAIATRGEFKLFYPAYTFQFDFPFMVWDDSSLSSARRSAVRQFGELLNQNEAQRQLVEKGFRPATITLTPANAPAFAPLVQAGLTLEVPKSLLVSAPSREGALSLLTWFDSIRRAP